MTEDNKDVMVYTNTIYEIVGNKRGNFACIYIHPESNERVEIPLDDEQFKILYDIVVEEKTDNNHKNIMNLFYIMRSADPMIKGFVLTEDSEGNFLIRLSMYLGRKAENFFAIDYSVETGISLAFLMEWPIFVTSDFFDKKKTTK